MTAILKSIQKIKVQYCDSEREFFFHHPLVAMLSVFIGIPVCILTILCLCTAIISFLFYVMVGF